MVTPRSIGGKAKRRRALVVDVGEGTIEKPRNLKIRKKRVNNILSASPLIHNCRG